MSRQTEAPTDDHTVVYYVAGAETISIPDFRVDGRTVGVTGETATKLGEPDSAIDFFFTSR